MATGNPYTGGQQALQLTQAQQILYPEIAAQQVQLSRQQQMAQMLREQSMAPADPTQVISGWAVKQSPLLGLGKIAQALAGGYMQNKGDERQLALSQSLQAEMNKTMGGSGAPAGPQYQNDPNGTGGPLPGQLGSGMSSTDGSFATPPDQAGSPINLGGAPSVPDAGPVPSAPAGVSQNNYNLGNLLKGSVIGSIGGDAASKSYWDQFAPTDATKLALAAGADPLAANQGALTKLNNIPPVRLGEGAYYDQKTGVTGLPTAAPAGFINIKGQDGQWTTAPVAGGVQAVQDSSQASASGKAAVTPVSGFDANGKPVFTNQLAAAQGGQALGAGAGSTPGNGRYPAPAGGAVSPSLTPSAQAAGTEAGKGAGELWNADSNAANGYATRMFTLNKALTGLQSSDTGPGSESVNGVKSFLMAQTPFGLGKYLPGVDPSKISSYDEANKYLMQYAIGQAGSMGQGTDGKLAAVLSGNANTHISNLAAQDVVKANMGLERMRQAQVQQFNNTGLSPDQYPKWGAQWNKQINPNVFVWDNLDPAKRATAAATMTPQQKQAFTAQYNWALQNKFIDGPQ